MNKTRILVALTLLCCISSAYAREDIRTRMQKTYPTTVVDEVRETGVEGLYEITTGANVIYYAPTTDSLIIGDILTKEGKNLSAARRKEVAVAKLENPAVLKKALKIGNGPTKVVLFTDPDCPYCRRTDAFLANRTDITLYIFFSPIAKLHPAAEAKTAYILGSKDPADSYRRSQVGEYDKVQLQAEKAGVAWMNEQKEVAASMGVRGTPVLYINGTQIIGADFAAIDKAITRNLITQ